jgi:hypothetical protein
MESLKQLESRLDKEIEHLETDPEEVAIAKTLDFLDRDIAGEVSDREAEEFFKSLED